MGVKSHYSSLGHPQSYGLVEATNKTLMGIVKEKFSDRKGAWVDELLAVLWAYHVIVRMPMGEAPFTLSYSHKAMPPVEVEIPTYTV